MQNRLSAWLRPSDAQCGYLTRVIRILGHNNGAPTFPPHVTIVGEVGIPADQAAERLRAAAATEHRLDVVARSAGDTNAFHRCVFLVCDKEPALMALNAVLRESLEDKSDDDYLPHLSLIYGDLASELREQIVAELAVPLPLTLELTQLSLVNTSGNDPRGWMELGCPIELRSKTEHRRG
jgi:2'-5' RNA ligase